VGCASVRTEHPLALARALWCSGEAAREGDGMLQGTLKCSMNTVLSDETGHLNEVTSRLQGT